MSSLRINEVIICASSCKADDCEGEKLLGPLRGQRRDGWVLALPWLVEGSEDLVCQVVLFS